jgi:predicted metal-dependent hydrolase
MGRTARQQLTLIGKSNITLNGQAISYSIKRSTRARLVRLEIRRETGLTVIIPDRYTIERLPLILEKKQNWILKKVSEHCEAQPCYREKVLESGDTVPYLGQELVIEKQQNTGNADGITLKQNRLAVHLRSTRRLNTILEQWYRAQAARVMKKKIDELSHRLGFTYNRLFIRSQKTRWGSCSRKGNISINWKLIMAPEPVIDYVIIHELAHLKEMNHTVRFWGLVAHYCPRYREHKKWLKEHEPNLSIKPSLLR